MQEDPPPARSHASQASFGSLPRLVLCPAREQIAADAQAPEPLHRFLSVYAGLFALIAIRPRLGSPPPEPNHVSRYDVTSKMR